jgi:hypothetical protein
MRFQLPQPKGRAFGVYSLALADCFEPCLFLEDIKPAMNNLGLTDEKILRLIRGYYGSSIQSLLPPVMPPAAPLLIAPEVTNEGTQEPVSSRE